MPTLLENYPGIHVDLYIVSQMCMVALRDSFQVIIGVCGRRSNDLGRSNDC